MREGDQLGEYALVRRLGQGGFGSVWLARSKRGEEVAIKVLHPKYCAPSAGRGPSMADRFLEEARILLSLRNPGVVEVREIIEDRERAAIAYVMEKLVGRDMTAVAMKLDLPSLLEVFARASDTLDFLHQRGVLHRDIKLANIFVCDAARAGDTDRAVKLIDFGVAKDQWARSVAESTATGMFVGTLETMAPECFRRLSGGDVELTGAVDQWGIGVALYHCLAGRPPFRADAFLPLMAAIEERPHPPLRLMPRFGLEEVPAGVNRVIGRLLAKRPEDRYPAAAAAAAALRGAADELTGPRSIRRPFAKLADAVPEPATGGDPRARARAAVSTENETLHAGDSGRWVEIDTSKERRPDVEEEDEAGRTERWSQAEIDLHDRTGRPPRAPEVDVRDTSGRGILPPPRNASPRPAEPRPPDPRDEGAHARESAGRGAEARELAGRSVLAGSHEGVQGDGDGGEKDGRGDSDARDTAGRAQRPAALSVARFSDPAEAPAKRISSPPAPVRKTPPPPPAPSTVRREKDDETIPDLAKAPAAAVPLVSPDFDQPLVRDRHAVRSVSVIPGIGVPVSAAAQAPAPAPAAARVVERGPAQPAPATAPATREVAIPLKVVLLIVGLTIAAAFSLGWLLRGD